jgi:hypothetical protein
MGVIGLQFIYKSKLNKNNIMKIETLKNGRLVIHFTDFLKDGEFNGALDTFDKSYRTAKNRAKSIGGKEYKGADYGGGFYFLCSKELLEKKFKTLGL